MENTEKKYIQLSPEGGIMSKSKYGGNVPQLGTFSLKEILKKNKHNIPNRVKNISLDFEHFIFLCEYFDPSIFAGFIDSGLFFQVIEPVFEPNNRFKLVVGNIPRNIISTPILFNKQTKTLMLEYR